MQAPSFLATPATPPNPSARPGSTLAYQKLDRAVLDAYGWGHDIGDEEILERLLALNMARAGG